MKITVTLKSPDCFSHCVNEAVRDEVDNTSGLDDAASADLFETLCGEVWSRLEKFFEYKEYVRIEFDTDAGTATVLPNKK